MQAKLLFLLASCLLSVNASSGKVGTNKIYNKWNEPELEKWLSDHHIPYPETADLKDLIDVVGKHWDTVTSKMEHSAQNSASSVKDWIFDSWTDSGLKAWLDYNHIPLPDIHTRDALLAAASDAYASVAETAKNFAGTPGHWLYQSWSDSDLQAWLDAHELPLPQGSNRNEMIALVRRNIRRASLEARRQGAILSDHITDGTQKVFQAGKDHAGDAADVVYAMAGNAADNVYTMAGNAADNVYTMAGNAADTVNEKIFDTWSDSQLKEWADKNGIPVPQGSKRNELLALVRRNKAYLTGDTFPESAYSIFEQVNDAAANTYGAAASKVSKASNAAADKASEEFDKIVSAWSDSQLKAYLDAHGILIPQNDKHDELLASVRKHKHKANNKIVNQSFFHEWNSEQLSSWLEEHGITIPKSGSRDELINVATENYNSASSMGGEAFKTLSNTAARVTHAAYDHWSDSDLKSYLDQHGISLPQGSTREAMLAKIQETRNQAPQWAKESFGYDILSKAQDCLYQIVERIKGTLRGASGAAYGEAEKVADYIKEKTHAAEHVAQEQAEKVGDRVKEEL